MRKLAILSVAFALVAGSFYGCDETNLTEPTDGSLSSENQLRSARALAASLFPAYRLTTSSTGVPMIVLDDPAWLHGSDAHAINDRGDVAGVCVPGESSEHVACVWTRKGVSMLPSPDAERPAGAAYGLNNRGQVVGEAMGPYTSVPVLWDKSGATVLGTFGDDGAGLAINNRGQAVGSSGFPTYRQYAFLWKKEQMIQLGTIYDQWDSKPDYFASAAGDINARGQIVGHEWAAGGIVEWHRAVMWQGDQVVDLGPAPTGIKWWPFGINNPGQIVGHSFDQATQAYRAVLWDKGLMTVLEASCGDSRAWDINDRGQVAGDCRFGDDWSTGRAYLWSDGEAHDLGTLGDGGSISQAINSRGMVAGHIWDGGRQAAVVWLTQFAEH